MEGFLEFFACQQLFTTFLVVNLLRDVRVGDGHRDPGDQCKTSKQVIQQEVHSLAGARTFQQMPPELIGTPAAVQRPSPV